MLIANDIREYEGDEDGHDHGVNADPDPGNKFLRFLRGVNQECVEHLPGGEICENDAYCMSETCKGRVCCASKGYFRIAHSLKK